MSFIHMPPKFLSPYSGTELGSAGNVFCTQIATASFIDGGPGFVLGTASSAFQAAPASGNWSSSGLKTSAPLAATTVGTGTGLTASFSVTSESGVNTAKHITVTVVNPGSGYVEGDILSWTNAAVTSALGTATGVAVTVSGLNSNPHSYEIPALENTGSVVTTVKAGQNGWQFSVNSIAALTQLVTITIPDNGIAGDDFADQDYVIVANITGGVAETATTTVGTITGSIFHHSDTNTEQITLRRVTGSAASTLLAGDVTVRLVKRMLPVV